MWDGVEAFGSGWRWMIQDKVVPGGEASSRDPDGLQHTTGSQLLHSSLRVKPGGGVTGHSYYDSP